MERFGRDWKHCRNREKRWHNPGRAGESSKESAVILSVYRLSFAHSESRGCGNAGWSWSSELEREMISLTFFLAMTKDLTGSNWRQESSILAHRVSTAYHRGKGMVAGSLRDNGAVWLLLAHILVERNRGNEHAITQITFSFSSLCSG